MMSPIHWSLFALVLLVAGGCDASDPGSTEEDQYVYVLLNGETREAFETSAGIFPNNRVRIGSYRYGGGQYAWGDELSVQFMYDTNQDAFPISTGAGYWELSGADAVIASYHGIDDEPHELRVTYYDPTTGVMEGEFEVTVVVDSSFIDWPLRQMPDTVRVTDGRFRVVLQEIPE